MRKFLISAALVTAAVVAAPASAQYYPHHYPNRPYDDRGYGQAYGRDGVWQIQRQFQQIDRRIEQGLRTGRISNREADRLYRQLRQTDRLLARYSRNGLSQWEYRDLQHRIDVLRQHVRYERRDWNDRRDGWRDGWNDRDDRWDDRGGRRW